jgi:tight adherence protein C
MDTSLLLPMLVVFASVATATGAFVWLLTDQQVTRRRLEHVATAPSVVSVQPQSVVADQLSHAVRRVRSFVPKSPKEMGRVERMMTSAGYTGAWPATLFAIAEVLLPIGVGGAIVSWFGFSVTALVFGGLAAFAAYMVPTFWLGRKIEARRKEIRNGLPDAIDLMIVCIESGSGIDQALNRVAEELKLAYPALAEELETISAETRAGKPRIEAFKNFAERTKVDDVRSLVAMLVQTDKFGTSIGQALRTHAETSRTKRRQRAEEKAAKLAVKLLFPLVFCLFPAFYTVVLGPSMVQIFRVLVWGNGIR